ncbi:MAG TPA: aldo/keto reductase [Chloroflexi bacterium]|nr:aldo/keto reductase [Chloroflexota bacterium]
MQYRPFGKLGFQVSALGFGAMRLPTVDGVIDEEEATRMIHYAIDQGVNYLDTAYPYHDGAGEAFVGRALKGGDRERVKLATKMPSWLVHSADDFDRYLDEQMERLQVDYLDFYLLHTLNKDHWPRLRDLGVREWAEKAVADGRFGRLGFSFHDDVETFKTIIDEFDWAMCQIQYNYMDVANQAGLEGLRYAAAKGIAVVIMEPLRGGKLVDPPSVIQEIWDSATPRRTPVEWALHWLWDQPEVSVVLSGMSTMEQVKQNIAIAETSRVHSLTDDERALIDRVRSAYSGLIAIPCTGCAYCMPCPQGVDIPGNLANYNEGIMYNNPESSRGHYAWQKFAYEVQQIFTQDVRAAACVQCGACETHCPQAIPISEWMPVIDRALGNGGSYPTRLPSRNGQGTGI